MLRAATPGSASADRAEAMRGIRTFAQVVQYLLDDQGWPNRLLDRLVDEDLTEVTYDWDPDELGIPADQLKGLNRLQQMRPLTANQPWGVFFLEFGGAEAALHADPASAAGVGHQEARHRRR